MSSIRQVITAQQLLAMPDDGWRYELVEGELRRMSPAGRDHGRIAMNLGARLAVFVRDHSLGVVFAAETGFLLRRDPDTVRAPDVAFVSAERWSPGEGFFPGSPDLAVEVVSPSDSFVEVEEKVSEWLAAGTRAVVVVNPRRRAVSLHRENGAVQRLGVSETLDLSFVVPGFRVGVAELFA